MRPLIFLTTRSFINAVRRAFTSGKRLVTLLFAVVYYGWLVLRPMGSRAASSHFTPTFFRAPSPTVVEAVIFGAFGFMSLLLMVTMVTPRAGFRQADVDVLFATPINPRAVMFFRMFRDYIATLISPFLLALFGGRLSYIAALGFFRGMDADGPTAMRVAAIAWFLMALAWTCIGYGVGFFINRSDLGADRNKKIIDCVIGGIIVATMVFVIYRVYSDPGWQGSIALTQSPFIRIVFFTATAASWMVMGSLRGDLTFIFLGGSILAAVSAFGVWLALTQLPYMYDQAAVKGFGSSERRMLQRSNDIYGLSAQKARDGKFRVGRLSRWIGRMRFSGASALVWKEVILQLRSGPLMIIFFGMILLMMMLPVVAATSRAMTNGGLESTGPMLFFMQGMGVFMLTMNTAISGFIELLKRVDFQKPLPFRPEGTVFWEVASKCIPNILMGGVASLLVLILRPVLWQYAISSEFFVIGLSLVVSATVFLVTISFSDAGDASQRGFRGILIMLGILVCASPSIGILALVMGVFHANPFWGVIPATIVNVAIAFGVSFFAGGQYYSFNPSE